MLFRSLQPQSAKFTNTGTDTLPLFPLTQSQAAAKPLIQFLKDAGSLCKSEVTYPAPKILVETLLSLVK